MYSSSQHPHNGICFALAVAHTSASTGNYDYLTLNRAWSTSTGGVTSDTRRPDVIGVRCDGKVDAWELISATDDPIELQTRVDIGMASLPRVNRGNTIVIPLFC